MKPPASIKRGKNAAEIRLRLNQARADASTAFHTQAADYWYWRCREAEIEWVANVASAILMAQGAPPIVPPTVRGVLKAAEIIVMAADA